MRDAAINLRALPEQRDLIDHAASLLGKNRSDFMLEAACDRAQSVVLDQVFFSLDADKFKDWRDTLLSWFYRCNSSVLVEFQLVYAHFSMISWSIIKEVLINAMIYYIPFIFSRYLKY